MSEISLSWPAPDNTQKMSAMNETLSKLSFIIPAFNEEKNISRTIGNIHKYVPNDCAYEVIVVDHGSTDQTVRRAQECRADVYVRNNGTIAGLRNFGADKASGSVYVFVDSDVSLTDKWKQNIVPVLHRLTKGERLMTGSWYSVPDKPNWIEKYWFAPLEKLHNTHINSGHLIISKQHFAELSGFDENLETGEDYDISMRAKASGLRVVDDHSLKVIHEGYPKSLWEFMRREYWHGKGDSASLGAVLKSKVALASLLFSGLHALFFLSLFSVFNPATGWFSLLGIAAVCLGASYIKFRHENFSIILMGSLIYYFYFVSRSASLIMAPFRNKVKKRQR